eukprot:GHVU01119817.1.p1 GENE.GHVU01119817.1~~GHVU01119817.1.p1  ORF type:complete len:472 (+),score=32.54 GHVU01119817.1:117-1532(+)
MFTNNYRQLVLKPHRTLAKRYIDSLQALVWLDIAKRDFVVSSAKASRSKLKVKGPKMSTLFTDIGVINDREISLVAGAPGPSHLKLVAEYINKGSQHLFEIAESRSFGWNMVQYGPPAGSPFYKEQLAAFLTRQYGSKVNSENIFATHGSTDGIMKSMYLVPPEAPVFVQDPTYFLALNIFTNQFKRQLIPVSTDNEGLLIDQLEKLCESTFKDGQEDGGSQYMFSAMVYLVPIYSNPSSMCQTKERSERLVEVARKYKLLIFCDDVYNLLQYDCDSPPERLFAIESNTDKDNQGCVISNGTFSKLLAPGLRTGWIEAAPRIIKALKSSPEISSGGNNHYMSMQVASTLELGIVDKHVTLLRHAYKDRVKAVMDIFREHLPDSVNFTEPKGGYYFWLEMPKYARATELLEMTKREEKITFNPGHVFSASKSCDNFLRIAISYYEKEVLTEAVEKICRCMQKYLASNAKLST